MNSKLFILLICFASLLALSSAASCDAQGQCKYGGRCGPNNQCICPMNCNPPTWNMNPEQLYCSPKKGQRPKIFWNICFVMAEACELQRDVPLIKFDFKKPISKQCQAKNAQTWHLCPKPEDFMGPCGGTLDQSVDGGVCLKDKNTQETRCECPQGKFGLNCDQKIVLLNLDKGNVTDEENDTNLIGVGLGATLVAGVLLGLFALIRFRKRKQNIDIEKHDADVLPDSKIAEFQNNRCDYHKDNNSNWSNRNCIVEIASDIENVSTDQTNSAASQGSPKRQRLSGISAHMPGDNNNNQAEKYERKNHSKNTKVGLNADEGDITKNAEDS
ncbi:uncharacterized protein LOC120348073 isoform X2 [Styela clava]